MVSPDSIVPNFSNPQSLNRYTYVLNSPLNFSDPTGHNPICNNDGSICSDGAYDDGKLDRRGDTARYKQSQIDSLIKFYNGPAPDAYAVGSTVSGSIGIPLVSVNGVVGGETVFNSESQEITRFWIIGYGFSGGLVDTNVFNPDNLEALAENGPHPYPQFSVAASLYGASIYNIDENWEYRGKFEASSATVAHGLGVTGGRGQTPNDDELVKPYSEYGGLVVGEGLSVDASQVWYIPVVTYDWGQRTISLPIIPYLVEVFQSQE